MQRLSLAAALAVLALGVGTGVYAQEAPAPANPAAEEAGPPPAKHNPVAQYFINRGKDFLDIFDLKLALSDDASLLAHVRATKFAQIGLGRFCGTKVGFQGASAGIYGEGRVEGGISIFYWAWIGRKTSKKGITEDAERTNRFFGHVEDIKAAATYRQFYDANRPWHTLGFAFALPFLPGIEAEVNPAEAIDFVLSWISIRGVRVPPPFYKVEVEGEKVPAPNSIRWHGQEEFEQYE